MTDKLEGWHAYEMDSGDVGAEVRPMGSPILGISLRFSWTPRLRGLGDRDEFRRFQKAGSERGRH
jgi:hypothetical protein